VNGLWKAKQTKALSLVVEVLRCATVPLCFLSGGDVVLSNEVEMIQTRGTTVTTTDQALFHME
jgi:hypothetical protein